MADQTHSSSASSEEKKTPDMHNMLRHIEALENDKANLLKAQQTLEQQLQGEKQRTEKLSAKTREGMQSALETLMKKWMDSVETKDDSVKDQFRCGLEKLVNNSAEDNGVWQMMVAASSLHERQVHDLDALRVENNELKLRLDGKFSNAEARTAGKRKADEQLDRHAAEAEVSGSSIWDDFAKDCGVF
jgi:hypothetical protein